MNLLLDTAFQPTYEELQRVLPHASLLHGQHGVGLYTIAATLVPNGYQAVVLHPTQKTKTSLPAISVESIRQLSHDVRSFAKQLVIIDDADSMTESAQNALLKLLEEPNGSTKFVLTSHMPERLLTTVRSRVQSYYVPLVSNDFIASLTKDVKIPIDQRGKMAFIASGRPAELVRLLADDYYFRERSTQFSLAKSLLGMTSYEIMAAIQKQKLDRVATLRVIDDMIHLLTLTPKEATVEKLSRLIVSRERVAYGGNTRLQLLTAMV